MREGLWTSIAGRLGPRWFRTEGPGRVALLKISGSAPLAAEGPLDLAIKGNLDAGLANRSMSAAGRRLTGSVAVDGRLGGAAAGGLRLDHALEWLAPGRNPWHSP
jgi:hypothetical protein